MSPWWETQSSHFSFNRRVILPACWNSTNGSSFLTSETAITYQPMHYIPGLTLGNCPAVVAFLWVGRQCSKLDNLYLFSSRCPLSEKSCKKPLPTKFISKKEIQCRYACLSSSWGLGKLNCFNLRAMLNIALWDAAVSFPVAEHRTMPKPPPQPQAGAHESTFVVGDNKHELRESWVCSMWAWLQAEPGRNPSATRGSCSWFCAGELHRTECIAKILILCETLEGKVWVQSGAFLFKLGLFVILMPYGMQMDGVVTPCASLSPELFLGEKMLLEGAFWNHSGGILVKCFWLGKSHRTAQPELQRVHGDNCVQLYTESLILVYKGRHWFFSLVWNCFIPGVIVLYTEFWFWQSSCASHWICIWLVRMPASSHSAQSSLGFPIGPRSWLAAGSAISSNLRFSMV